LRIVDVPKAIAVRIQIVILVHGVLVDLPIAVVVAAVAHFRSARIRGLASFIAIPVQGRVSGLGFAREYHR